MKKSRLKSFISIINIISCIVIFGMATMTLVSPGLFAYEESYSSSEKENIASEAESESFSKSEETVYGAKPQLESEEGVIENEEESLRPESSEKELNPGSDYDVESDTESNY